MNKYIREGDNPDITDERQKATFDTDALGAVIFEGPDRLTKRREIAKYVEDHKDLHDSKPIAFMDRLEKLENASRKIIALKKHAANVVNGSNPYEASVFKSLVMRNEGHPFFLHDLLTVPVMLANFDDEQLEQWLPKAVNYELNATYAQTEMGHGTNLKDLETTATYDPKSEEFIVNSPTVTSLKWWPGNLGKSANYVMLQAQLIINGKGLGAHLFWVQIRDLDTHKPLTGITVGDIGPKFGVDTIDNGFIKFDNIRIPRRNMFMKHAKVDPDGIYHPPIHAKLGYSSMLYVRSNLIDEFATHIAQSATIAIRYSTVRRQGVIEQGKSEVKILDYQTQQYRLFPHLARSFAFFFTGRYIRDMCTNVMNDIGSGKVGLLADLHAISCGLKATVSFQMMLAIEQCRMACGGHGYSLVTKKARPWFQRSAFHRKKDGEEDTFGIESLRRFGEEIRLLSVSGLPQLYTWAMAGCTIEGENIVMLLQLARYLMKVAHSAQHDRPPTCPSKIIEYFFRKEESSTCLIDQETASHNEHILTAFEHASKRATFDAYNQLETLKQRGLSTEHARNELAVELCKAAKAHCRIFIARKFVEQVDEINDLPVRNVLNDLLQLYLYYEVTEAASSLMEDNFMSGQQLNFAKEKVYSLLEKIRPNAVSIVDSFDFTDRQLDSVLGRRDGHIYENLLKWAMASSLNKDEVLPFHHNYVGKVMSNARNHSKL